MKKCIKCGKDCNDHENFCSNCGSNEFKQVEQYAPQMSINDNLNNEGSQNENTNTSANYYSNINNQNAYGQSSFNDINQNQNINGSYNQNTNNQYNANPYNYQNNFMDPDKSRIEDAKVCGIVSLVIVIFGLAGLSWIPALVGKNRLKQVVNLRSSSDFNTAKLLNNIGMIISIISIVLVGIVILLQIAFVIFGVGFGIDLLNDLPITEIPVA